MQSMITLTNTIFFLLWVWSVNIWDFCLIQWTNSFQMTSVGCYKWCMGKRSSFVMWYSFNVNVVGFNVTEYEKYTDTYTQGELHMKMKAEIKGVHLYAKDCQRLLANTRSWKRSMEQILPHCHQKEPTLLTLWSWACTLQNCEKINKSPSLWGLVVAALKNEYSRL